MNALNGVRAVLVVFLLALAGTAAAQANKRPEWEGEIRSTFAQRWIERAQPGWYYQNPSGAWVHK